MKYRIKKIVNILSVFSILLLMAVGCSRNPQSLNDQSSAESAPSAVVAEQSVMYEGVEGKTAMQLLKETHQVETKNFEGIGEFVDSIDGKTPDSKHFWAFYVNGESSQIGASQYQTKAGDRIEWKLEEIK